MENKSHKHGFSKDSSHKLFMGLVLANQKKLYVYILSMVFHVNDADDILQDTLVLMWENLTNFSRDGFYGLGKAIARIKS